jgi:hypothetical protein
MIAQISRWDIITKLLSVMTTNNPKTGIEKIPEGICLSNVREQQRIFNIIFK